MLNWLIACDSSITTGYRMAHTAAAARVQRYQLVGMSAARIDKNAVKIKPSKRPRVVLQLAQKNLGGCATGRNGRCSSRRTTIIVVVRSYLNKPAITHFGNIGAGPDCKRPCRHDPIKDRSTAGVQCINGV